MLEPPGGRQEHVATMVDVEVRNFIAVRVKVLSGPDLDKEATMSGDRLVIGGHASTDLSLADSLVSRFHCEIVRHDNVMLIRDLGSRNGTIVDGLSIREAILTHRSVLTIGSSVISIELVTNSMEVRSSPRKGFGIMVGATAPMRHVFAQLERAAASDVTVLLTGETGTGKEAAAESIHRESTRADGPFVVVDCGAIPAELLESELFGHEKGAFTGAVRSRLGAFQSAHGGTVFLDEIGELPKDLQPKLLRVLSRHTIKPVGQEKHIEVDVRVIAATNRDLRQEVNADRFRGDLYYRLAVVEVRLPPLRERRADLPALVETLLKDIHGSPSDKAAMLTEASLAELQRHPWLGNVRELQNYVARRLALGDLANEEDLDAEEAPVPAGDLGVAIDLSRPFREARDQHTERFERAYLRALLKAHAGKIAPASRAAHIDRVHLYRLLSKHGLR